MSQAFDEETIAEYVQTHIDWSRKTFGEGEHTEGLLKHIEKEVNEVREAYYQGTQEGITEEQFGIEAGKEFVDIIILSLDAMQRLGFTANDITRALIEKQRINMERKYPKITDPNEPTEHIRKEI